MHLKDILNDFYAYLDTLTTISTLACDWGSWQVYVNGQIDVLYIGSCVCTIRIPFREPVVNLSGGAVPSSEDFEQVSGIDGVDFEALGFTLVNFEQMGIRANRLEGQLHRPNPKAQEALGYVTEPYQITRTEARQIQLKGVIVKSTFAEVETTVKNLYALFAQPGTRVLYIPEDRIRIVFAKSGFQISRIRGGGTWTAELEVTLTEGGEYTENETYQFLTDTIGRYVTNTVGQKS